MPSSSQAPEPSSSFSAGMPNSRTAGIPSAATSPASATAPATEKREIPGIDAIGGGRPDALLDEDRHHEVPGGEPGLAHEVAQDRRAAQAPQARGGKGHHPQW